MDVVAATGAAPEEALEYVLRDRPLAPENPSAARGHRLELTGEYTTTALTARQQSPMPTREEAFVRVDFLPGRGVTFQFLGSQRFQTPYASGRKWSPSC